MPSTPVADALTRHVDAGDVPGLVAVVGRSGDLDVTVLGDQAVGGPPMREDSLFRIASIGKPITAAATLALVADGVVALDDPVGDLLPELARRASSDPDVTARRHRAGEPADHGRATCCARPTATASRPTSRPQCRRCWPSACSKGRPSRSSCRRPTSGSPPSPRSRSSTSRRGLHVQRRVRHPRCARRPGDSSLVPRLPRRADPAAARHGGDRLRVRGRDRRAADVVLPPRRRRPRAPRRSGRAVGHRAAVPVRRRRPRLDRGRARRLRGCCPWARCWVRSAHKVATRHGEPSLPGRPDGDPSEFLADRHGCRSAAGVLSGGQYC